MFLWLIRHEDPMGKPYSQDLRDRVLAAVDGGLKPGAVAELFHVDVSYIYKILIRRRTSGMTTALPWAGGPQPKLKGHHEVLRQHVSENCDATLAEIRTFLLAEHGIEVSVGCLWNALKQLKLPLKKRHNAPPSRSAKTSPKRAEPGTRLRAI